MILGGWKIFTGFIFICFLTISGSSLIFDSGNRNGQGQESELIMKSLEGALEFFLKRPDNVTMDVALGVLIANANLEWIYNLSRNSWLELKLNLLLEKCRRIIEIVKNRNNFALLNETLWERAAGDLKFGFLYQHEDEFYLPEFDSCRSIDDYMMKGTPEASDFCINELLSSNCQVSDFCWFSEVNEDSYSGYKTSHRLLYFQLAFKMNCEEVNPERFFGIRKTKHKLCHKMYLEATALFNKPSISLTRDLFMEQIALCGLEGYLEFASQLWRDQVKAWQNFNGCFGLDDNFTNCSLLKNKISTKRTDSVIDDCHTHVTAVAISALGFFLRVILNNFSL